MIVPGPLASTLSTAPHERPCAVWVVSLFLTPSSQNNERAGDMRSSPTLQATRTPRLPVGAFLDIISRSVTMTSFVSFEAFIIV